MVIGVAGGEWWMGGRRWMMQRRVSAMIGLVAAVGSLCVGVWGGGCVPRWGEPGPYYPDPAPRAEALDIQVFREETRLRLTNTTARAFGPGRLWVNMWWSHPIEGLGVGESLDLNLARFRDEHGEGFRAGGFFASENPEDVVSVELEEDRQNGAGALYPLIVVRENE